MSLEQEAQKWLQQRYKDMQLNDYQRKSVEFAIYPHSHSILYPALGLAGEAGEVANKVKKFIRDGYDQENFEQKKIELASEIGDVLWYCAMLATEMNVSLGKIMDNNLEKLYGRKQRGKLQGSGDTR